MRPSRDLRRGAHCERRGVISVARLVMMAKVLLTEQAIENSGAGQKDSPTPRHARRYVTVSLRRYNSALESP
jgi:hypothetical protein